MKGKKDKKGVAGEKNGSTAVSEPMGPLTSTQDLKTFLLALRDKMVEGQSAAIYAVSAMNHVLTLPKIGDYLDNENKELARDIWLRIKQSGMQLRNPPMLFSPEEAKLGSAA